MPSSIPYDPSLALMSVVSDVALDIVKAIAQAQAPVDAAKDNLNSLLSSKRSLAMTKTELKNLGVNSDDLDRELKNLERVVEDAAGAYATAKVTSGPQVLKLQEQLRKVNRSIESPIDRIRSEIKTMPMAADSMNIDVEYFAFDSHSQTSASFSSHIGAYVSTSVSNVFGPTVAQQVGAAASRQVSSQVGTNHIEGTLVLSVTSTHKGASIVAPFVLDIDKATEVWNRLFPGEKLDFTSRSTMMSIAMHESQEETKKFSVISGTTFGSTFVGMVHILNSRGTSTSESLAAAALSMQATINTGTWFAKTSGKVGVDSKLANDLRSLLSQQNAQSNVTLLTMGVSPFMVANEASIAINVMQNANLDAESTANSMVEPSRSSGQATEMQNKTFEATLNAIPVVDGDNNKVLDITSMLTALDDYLKKAAEGNSGVPINYYLKDIDQKMLAQMWAAKYFPGQFMALGYDDAEGCGPIEPAKDKL
ncbi:hypothetical protein HJFPF1_09776 [Paramyrothecium foliicola]|nr:hypothetical protein HJFPF1_09776 [Paramyrothecium foliicola]